MLSVPASTPPLPSTLAASANRRSWSSTDGRWWSMVKHTTPEKRPVGKRHLGRVPLHDGHALGQDSAQPLTVIPLELEHAELTVAACEHARGGPEAGAYLQHVLAKLHSLEAPRKQLALNCARPPSRRTDEGVRAIHGLAQSTRPRRLASSIVEDSRLPA